MTTRTARRSTVIMLAAAALSAAPASATASTVTASQSGRVTFRGTTGESAELTINAVSKSSRGRMVHGVVVVDRGTDVLTPKGLCRRGSSPRRVICVTARSPRLRAFRVRFEGGDDILRWKGFDGLRRLSIRAFGGSGDDRLSLPRVGGRLYGGEGDDRLYGAGGVDRLVGGPGNDRLIGFGGKDLLAGDDGSDVLDGGEGRDRLLAGAGDDMLTGGLGIDRFNGGSGNDTIDSADAIAEPALQCGDGHDSLVRDGGDGVGAGDCENVTSP